MHKIVWSDELSVGIEAIDNDHKKLIAIINKMAEEIDGEKSDLLKHFSALEDYTQYHFSREEKWMYAQCHSDDERQMIEDHIREHHHFIEKLATLKKRIEETNSTEIHFEVIDFLMEWLLEHIISKDLSLSQCFITEQHKSAEKREPIFNHIVNTLSSRFTLNTKVKMLIILPFLVIFGLLLYQSFLTYQTYKELDRTETVADAFIGLDKVIDSIQEERGLSYVWYLEPSEENHDALERAREKTDMLIETCRAKMDQLKAFIDPTPLREKLLHLPQMRQALDNHSLPPEHIRDYYRQIVHEAIMTIRRAGQFYEGFRQDQIHASLLILFALKENENFIRYTGYCLLASKDADVSSDFIHYLKLREGYMNTLNILAAKKLSKLIDQIEHSPNMAILARYEKALKEKNSASVNLKAWMELTQSKIDAYGELLRKVLKHVKSVAHEEKNEYLTYILILWISVLLMLIFLIALLYALKQSIVQPIESITKAMHNLTRGDKRFYFNTYDRDDLIGKMILSYNNLRKYLIKSEYTEALLDLQEEKVRTYEILSYIDPLTALYNRRKYTETLELLIKKVEKHRELFSLLVADLDKFKNINDKYGHDAGDEVLKRFAKMLTKTVGERGTVARIGGEEFAIVLPNTDHKAAMEIANEILEATRQMNFDHIDPNLTLTTSIGLETFHNGDTLEELIDSVDKNLYRAKDEGRNRACC